MTELTTIRLRTLVWFLLLPLPIMGLIPWWLHRQFDGPAGWTGHLWQWVGLWLIFNGIGLAGWCVNLFNVAGQGTPVPFDPPKQFVARGPYQYVRNPMMLGMVLVLSGEAAFYESRAVWIYILALVVVAHLFVCCWEEPDLERRFGESYRAYKRSVPRWIPRPISRAKPSRTQ
jgi:protein-S-isoprenylcysteine O-methyltransferase Ste14